MANKKISEVTQVNGLDYIYGRQSGDIVQSQAKDVSVGGIKCSLSKTGLSPVSDRVTIVSGSGISVLGDLVLVQIRITAKVLIATGEFRFVVSGLPNPPSSAEVALSCAVESDETAQTLWAFLNDNGVISIYSETDIPAGLNLVITGIYKKA